MVLEDRDSPIAFRFLATTSIASGPARLSFAWRARAAMMAWRVLRRRGSTGFPSVLYTNRPENFLEAHAVAFDGLKAGTPVIHPFRISARPCQIVNGL